MSSDERPRITVRRAIPADASTLAELGASTFTETFAEANTPEDFAAYMAAAFGESIQREELEEELRAAGYSSRTIPLHQRAVRSRDWVLERIRGRFISTLQLLDEDEFAEGLRRAERELPAEVEAEQYLLAVVAERGR